jgi:proline dehydrogenase
MSKELTLKERELLCSQKGATWDLPFKHKIADKWRIPKFSDELTEDQIEYLNQKQRR